MSNLEQALQLNLFEEMAFLPTEFEKYTHSEEYEKNINRLIDKMRGDKLHRFTKKTATIILVAAIIFVLIIVGFAATVGREFIIRTFSDHFEYSIADRSHSQAVTDLQVGYIPEGFVLKEKNDYKGLKDFLYENGEYNIDIKKCHVNSTITYDSEVINEKEIIDGIEYIFYSSSDSDYLGCIFNNGDYIFKIDGNIPKEELLRIAQNVS